MKQQRLPVYYFGAKSLFNHLQSLKIQTTLLIPQPCVLTIIPEYVPLNEKSFLEPMLSIIIISEETREAIVKNGFKSFNDNTLYIYYPYEVRVDQAIYKARLSGYETLIKEVPRSQRDYFCRLIIWEEGKGDHSLQGQINKICSNISKEAKIAIEKRMSLLLDEQKRLEMETTSYSKTMRLHMNRLKVCKIYEYLKLYSWGSPIVQDQYKAIWLAMEQFNNIPLYKSRVSVFNPVECKTQYIFDLLIDQNITLLELVTHCFYQVLRNHVKSFKLTEGLTALKEFLSMVDNNIFKKVLESSKNIEYEKIFQGLWIIQLIQYVLAIVNSNKNFLTAQKKIDYDILFFNLKMLAKDKYEEIGMLLYNFDRSTFNFRNMALQIQYFLEEMRKSQSPTKLNPIQLIIKQQEVIKDLQQIRHPAIKEAVLKYEQYIRFYLQYIQDLIVMIKDTKLKRIEFYLKMKLMKVKLQYPNMIASDRLLNEDIKQQIQSWDQLKQLYYLYLSLFYYKTHRIEEFENSISILIKTKGLNKAHRYSLLALLSQKYSTGLRLSGVAGLNNSIDFKETEQGYQIMATFELYFDCEDSFNGLELTFLNIKNKSQVVFSMDKMQFKNCQLLCTGEVVTKQYLVLSFVKAQIKFNNVYLALLGKSDLRKKSFLLNEIKVEDQWYSKDKIVYKHILNPILFTLKNLKKCSRLRFLYATNQIFHSKALINGQEIQLTQKTEHTFTVDQQVVTLKIWALAKQDEYESLAHNYMNFKFIVDCEQVHEVIHKIKFKIKQSLQIRYQPADRLYYFIIKNNSPLSLHIHSNKREYRIHEGEQLSVRSAEIQIGLENEVMLKHNLNELCLNKDQIMIVAQRFGIRLEKTKIRLFQNVRIQSEIIGQIRVIKFDGYQLIGKIKGSIEYQSNTQFINLSIVTVKTGKIVLPEIYIDGKKGEWKNPVVIEVEE